MAKNNYKIIRRALHDGIQWRGKKLNTGVYFGEDEAGPFCTYGQRAPQNYNAMILYRCEDHGSHFHWYKSAAMNDTTAAIALYKAMRYANQNGETWFYTKDKAGNTYKLQGIEDNQRHMIIWKYVPLEMSYYWQEMKVSRLSALGQAFKLACHYGPHTHIKPLERIAHNNGRLVSRPHSEQDGLIRLTKPATNPKVRASVPTIPPVSPCRVTRM